MTSKMRRRSTHEVAMGTSVEWSIQSGAGHRPTAPFVGLRPTSPQRELGIRTEPPPSVPVATPTNPAASAAPDPPLEPPGERSRFQGLRVIPVKRFAVYPSIANSGRVDFPTTTAPA